MTRTANSLMKLVAFGSNGKGQLGINSIEDSALPLPCFHSVTLGPILPITSLSVKKVTGGGNHSAVLTNAGEIWTSGDDSFSQRGGNGSGTAYTRMTFLDGTVRWRDVACGWTSTVFVSGSGEVYVMGQGKAGELGLGSKATIAREPTLVEGIDDVVQIACGLRHVVALRRDGSVWGWGSSRHGELGPVSPTGSTPTMLTPSSSKRPTRQLHPPIWYPVLVHTSTPQFSFVAAGDSFTVLLTTTGDILTTGQNKHGQLGRLDPRTYASSASAARVDLPSRVTQVSAGWHHAVAVLESGEMWAWGRADHGQLGMRAPKEEGDGWLDELVAVSFRPVRMQAMGVVREVACGSEHAVAMLEDGRAVAWGWNEHGNCGNGDIVDGWEPNVVKGVEGRVEGIGAGCGSSWVWTRNEVGTIKSTAEGF